MGAPARITSEEQALQAEYRALAIRLEARRSVDEARRGAFSLFAGAIAAGLSLKLAYERWGPEHPRTFGGPLLTFFLATGAALLCLLAALAFFARARRRMRVEDQDFARLRGLRARLGLDP
jgi:hypothetical protein